MTKEEYLKYFTKILQSQDDRNVLVETGLGAINSCFNGNSFSKLVLVSGRKGMGIDAFLVTLIANIAFRENNSLCLITAKNYSEKYLKMLLGHINEIPTYNVCSKHLSILEKNKLLNSLERIDNSPFHIHERLLTIQNIWIVISRQIQEHGTSLFIIPNIEEIHGFNKDKSTIVKYLKEICQTLNIMIITSLELKSKVELPNGETRPSYSHVPKKIRLIYNLILLLYRPEYYKITNYENGEPTAGIAEIIVAKKTYPCNINYQFKLIGGGARFEPLE